MTEYVVVRNADEWRAWLAAHHETESEAWVLCWKKGSGRDSIARVDAVEVALAFGWIDGLIRGIDEDRYVQRWIPRRPKSKWSQVNKEIALRLIASGEMRPMGLAAVDAARASGEWDRAYTVQPRTPIPSDLKAAVNASAPAKVQQHRISRTRWDRWLLWLDATEGRVRTRRITMIVRALESKDYARVDAAAKRSKRT